MSLVIRQNFTLPDFQAETFTPSISPNFNSLSEKKHKKWEKMEKFTPLAKILHCHQQWRETQISPLLVICHLSLVMCHISLVPSKCHNKALQNGYWHPWMASRSEKVREKLHYILNQHTRDCSKTQCEREKQLNFDQRLKIWNCARTGAGSCPEREAWSWRPLSSSGEQRQEYLRISYTIWEYLKISYIIWEYLRIINFTWRWEAKISQEEITAYLDWETSG